MIVGEYRFSISVETGDDAVLACLRSLAEHSQLTGNRRIVSFPGPDGEGAWTFRFSEIAYRDRFTAEARRLLPKRLWNIQGASDHNPPAAFEAMN